MASYGNGLRDTPCHLKSSIVNSHHSTFQICSPSLVCKATTDPDQDVRGDFKMFALLSSSLFLFSFALAVLITFSMIRGSRNTYVPTTSTVLHSFSIRTEPGSEPYIHVVGRHKGILAWILSGLNIENKVELKVTERDWSLRDASLSGMRVEYFPLKNVSASICGYQRSRIALFFSVFFALVSLGTLAEALPGIGTILNAKSEYIRESTAGDVSAVLGRLLLWTLLCGIALLIYITSKRVAFGVRANGVTGIVFKRSLIENKVIDLADAELATVLMNHLFSSAVYGMPISQVLRGGTPQAPSSGSRTSWGTRRGRSTSMPAPEISPLCS